MADVRSTARLARMPTGQSTPAPGPRLNLPPAPSDEEVERIARKLGAPIAFH